MGEEKKNLIFETAILCVSQIDKLDKMKVISLYYMKKIEKTLKISKSRYLYDQGGDAIVQARPRREQLEW